MRIHWNRDKKIRKDLRHFAWEIEISQQPLGSEPEGHAHFCHVLIVYVTWYAEYLRLSLFTAARPHQIYIGRSILRQVWPIGVNSLRAQNSALLAKWAAVWQSERVQKSCQSAWLPIYHGHAWQHHARWMAWLPGPVSFLTSKSDFENTPMITY